MEEREESADCVYDRDGHPYVLPAGFVRLALKKFHPDARALSERFDWPVIAYHGTGLDHVDSILEHDGKEIRIHGEHIGKPRKRVNEHTGKDEMFCPRQIYTSPSVKYVAKNLCPEGDVWARQAIDPLFPDSSLEYYTKQISAVFVYGLLIKLEAISMKESQLPRQSLRFAPPSRAVRLPSSLSGISTRI
eukprot:g81939.t1